MSGPAAVDGEISALADELVAARAEADPVEASLLGLDGPHHRLADYAEESRQRSRDQALAVARAATAVDPVRLSDADRTTRELIVQQACALAARVDVRSEEFAVSDGLSAPALWPLVALPMIGLNSEEMAHGYLDRLAALPEYLATVAGRQRAGLERGLAPPEFLVRAGLSYLDRYLGGQHGDPLCAVRPLVDVPGFERHRDALVADVVRPAYARYRMFLATELAPRARPEGQAGLWWQPGGEHRYTALTSVYTTTEYGPDELHNTGLSLIERLTGEFAEAGERVFGTHRVAEIFERLRGDTGLRWSSAGELLDAARAAIRRAEAVAPYWFDRFPTEPIEVKPIPEAEAGNGAVAYYTPPSLDGSRRGTYFANITDPGSRCRYLAEAIAFHEAIPGHHFQVTTAHGLDKLPLLRRIAEVDAYAEGWALYAERLADEMGLYSGEPARLGMLAQESLRAARLVVDTGLHAYGWSRRRAMDYLLEHTPLPPSEIVAEVDRYAAVPAQALSYMVGRLEIQRLRSEAESRLGRRFDIRRFHAAVLDCGPVPLPVLSSVVRDWIDAQFG
ncbi:DUF885 domain-containing protein [Haloechinothrix sp. LS1_15]|uniref:DUF885 domain-containing protein n=1 Tax=Haloechinothrix sp. LS1_15 TaxID=2652248 RepID=UPI00294580E9|nr:DUF885 domain-containing protein [Haloechinothrix sp. LS1_15]MDV6013453.1 DUF885 domain-containing protein [Haloechinothrix sp. LS1_15]